MRIPDTEGIHRRIAVCTFEIASTRQDSESSCNSKVLFSMREIPACGENRSLEGLSWPGEKAEAMRLCERKLSAHEWISQKTYKPSKIKDRSRAASETNRTEKRKEAVLYMGF